MKVKTHVLICAFFAMQCISVACVNDAPPDWDDFSGAPDLTAPGERPVTFALTAGANPPTEAPVGLWPTGTSITENVEYNWTPIPGGTYQYLVWVNDRYGAAAVQYQITEVDAQCEFGQGGQCALYDSGVSLQMGNHRWYVAGQDEQGNLGPWSTGLDFNVNWAPLSAPAVIPTEEMEKTTPTFTWSPSDFGPTGEGAYQYQVWVNDRNGNVVVDEKALEGDAGCPRGVGTCDFSPDVVLAPGFHKVYVRGMDSASNTGPWSDGVLFNVLPFDSTPASGLAPTGPTYDETYLRWSPIAGGVAEYQIWINNGDGIPTDYIITEDMADCAGGNNTCWYILPPQPFGFYRFYIRGISANGTRGSWSAGSLYLVDRSCSPVTCEMALWDCGFVPDNFCGEPIVNACGTCTLPETCGASVPNECD